MAWWSTAISSKLFFSFSGVLRHSKHKGRFTCRWYHILARMESTNPSCLSPSSPPNVVIQKECDSSIGHEPEQILSGLDRDKTINKEEAQSTGITDTGDVPVAAYDIRKYQYPKRTGFTSELFKLEVINLPPYVGFGQLRNRLKSLKLNPVKIKISQPLCFVTFRSEEEKQEAMKAINGHVWKKKKLRAISAKPSMDPIMKRKREAATVDDPETKRPCEDAQPKDMKERLAEAITPLVHLPYEEQLSIKLVAMKEVLVKTARSIGRLKPGVWFDKHIASNDGLLCTLDPIKPSPVLTEYRNKCEFNIGLGSHNDTAVGFRVGAYKDGDLTIVPPNSIIVSEKSKKIVEMVQELMSDSTLKPFDCRTLDGHWKQVTVRHFTTGETMAIIQFHPQQLSQDIVLKEKQLLIDKFRSVGDDVLTSLYWQTVQERTAASDQTAYEHLLGSKYVHEELLGVRFRVSPDAFFQVNSKATEVLYSTIGELVAMNNKGPAPVVYDLCCGTGSIGITLAKNIELSKVIGVEMVERAVEDAKHNAAANGLKNADFICGKVENTLSSLFIKEGRDQSDVVAIADPPRAGLHPTVIQAIRKCSNIKTLIYVACNPAAAANNYMDLCRPKSNRIKGLPFCPVRAVPVDLFPHTKHCELVIMFQRIDPLLTVSDTNELKEKELLVNSESEAVPCESNEQDT